MVNCKLVEKCFNNTFPSMCRTCVHNPNRLQSPSVDNNYRHNLMDEDDWRAPRRDRRRR